MTSSQHVHPLELSKDNVYRAQFENLVKENHQLKNKINALERENRALKNSVFQLSNTSNIQAAQLKEYTKVHGSKEEVNELSAQLPDSNNDAIIEGQHNSVSTSNGKNVASVPANKNNRTNVNNGSFVVTHVFNGHESAVYTCEWSPCGRILASGSFDKTVRLWTPSQSQVCKFNGHSQLISSLCWSADSSQVISGSFDNKVNVWEVESDSNMKNPVNSYATKGLVQTVSQCKTNDCPYLVYAGTSKGVVHYFDARVQAEKQINHHFVIPELSDDIQFGTESKKCSMVNALAVLGDGNTLLSGDSNGILRLWDIRDTSTPVSHHFIQNEEFNRPISHITTTTCKNNHKRSYVAVNSYDNILRVYTLSDILTNTQGITPIRTYKGHSNQNWPIKSSFYTDFTTSNHNTQLLATGSSTSSCYVYNFQDGTLYQKLRGHAARVYCCSFNPHVETAIMDESLNVADEISSPCLATCSADSTVKLWCKSDPETELI